MNMDSAQKLKKSYSHVLIGLNFSSLFFAQELYQRGESFCILDSNHIGHSVCKWIPSLNDFVFTRLPINTQSTPEVRESLDTLWGTSELLSGPPLTYDKGQFRSFVGFGDHKVESMDAVTPYCQTDYLQWQQKPEKIWQETTELLKDCLFLDQEITDIEYQKGQVLSIWLNGKTQLSGQQFHFFDRIPFLFEKVGGEIKKLASQAAKQKWYSSVTLIVHHQNHPPQFEPHQLYLLKGAKEQACLGVFSLHGEQLVSRWESFIPSELTLDAETTGTTLREIKRQIRRAFYPEGSTTQDPEHIVIQNQVFCELNKLDFKSGKLGNFNNLYVYSSLFGHDIGYAHEGLLGWQAAQVFINQEKNTLSDRMDVAAPGSPC